jgi:hypothetical protein
MLQKKDGPADLHKEMKCEFSLQFYGREMVEGEEREREREREKEREREYLD